MVIDTDALSAFNNSAGVMEAKAISDRGYDNNADSREAPEVKITKIYARLGSVVIVGVENNIPTEKQITVNEAVMRSRALLDMVKTPWKYQSDLKQVRGILRMFMTAIENCNKQLAAITPSTGVLIG